MVTGVRWRRKSARGCEVEHSPPSRAVIKNECSYTSSSCIGKTLPVPLFILYNLLKITVICLQRTVTVWTSLRCTVPYHFHNKHIFFFIFLYGPDICISVWVCSVYITCRVLSHTDAALCPTELALQQYLCEKPKSCKTHVLRKTGTKVLWIT
jgi:hypothetical protein